MGAEQSVPSQSETEAGAAPSFGSYKGYHVLSVQPHSPADDAGLLPFFDYIVGANGVRLDEENTKLPETLHAGIGKEVSLNVYSTKTRKIRDVVLKPATGWGGDGVLGCSVRFADFENAESMIFHVLDMNENSPAAKAGLRAHSDYIIGSDAAVLATEDDFAYLMAKFEKRPLSLFVYNFEDDACRQVTVVPDATWGGGGRQGDQSIAISLGCSIGHGLIHRIPAR